MPACVSPPAADPLPDPGSGNLIDARVDQLLVRRIELVQGRSLPEDDPGVAAIDRQLQALRREQGRRLLRGLERERDFLKDKGFSPSSMESQKIEARAAAIRRDYFGE